MDIILEKAIGSILESKDYSYSKEFLDQLTELSLQFIKDLTTDLSSYTRIQRRHQPSISDIKLLFKIKHIKNIDLIDEIEKSKSFPYRKELSHLLEKYSNIKQHSRDQNDQGDDDDDNESRPFFEKSSIMELVPRINSRPNYIPSYLPDLPPDYTYQSTPEYMEPLTDLKKLRIKLVDESRMTQESLYKLIENDEIEWRMKFEDELKELEVAKVDDDNEKQVEEIKVKELEENVPKKEVAKKEVNDEAKDTTKTEGQGGVKDEAKEGAKVEAKEAPKAESKVEEHKEDFKFDIVEYAQKRKKLKLKKEKQLEDHYKARENDIFMKAELYYSPYATKKPTAEINQYFKDILSDGFKEVIASVRKAEIAKQEKIKQLHEEQARREKELQQQNELAFSFPALNRSDSDDSDDSDNDMDMELNFDAPEKSSQTERTLVVVQNGDTINNDDNNTGKVRVQAQAQDKDKDKAQEKTIEIESNTKVEIRKGEDEQLPVSAATTTETANVANVAKEQSASPDIDLNLEDELNAHFGSISPEPIRTQEVSDISSEDGSDDEEMETVA